VVDSPQVARSKIKKTVLQAVFSWGRSSWVSARDEAEGVLLVKDEKDARLTLAEKFGLDETGPADVMCDHRLHELRVSPFCLSGLDVDLERSGVLVGLVDHVMLDKDLLGLRQEVLRPHGAQHVVTRAEGLGDDLRQLTLDLLDLPLGNLLAVNMNCGVWQRNSP
jgi:hypothetical protein